MKKDQVARSLLLFAAGLASTGCGENKVVIFPGSTTTTTTTKEQSTAIVPASAPSAAAAPAPSPGK